MLKFKDFKYSDDLENWQKNNDVLIEKIDTVEEDIFVPEWYKGFKYKCGYEKQAKTRIYYKEKQAAE